MRKSVKSRNRVETERSFAGWRAVGNRIILSERMKDGRGWNGSEQDSEELRQVRLVCGRETASWFVVRDK